MVLSLVQDKSLLEFVIPFAVHGPAGNLALVGEALRIFMRQLFFWGWNHTLKYTIPMSCVDSIGWVENEQNKTLLNQIDKLGRGICRKPKIKYFFYGLLFQDKTEPPQPVSDLWAAFDRSRHKMDLLEFTRPCSATSGESRTARPPQGDQQHQHS